jgi:hypothetical protein
LVSVATDCPALFPRRPPGARILAPSHLGEELSPKSADCSEFLVLCSDRFAPGSHPCPTFRVDHFLTLFVVVSFSFWCSIWGLSRPSSAILLFTKRSLANNVAKVRNCSQVARLTLSEAAFSFLVFIFLSSEDEPSRLLHIPSLFFLAFGKAYAKALFARRSFSLVSFVLEGIISIHPNASSFILVNTVIQYIALRRRLLATTGGHRHASCFQICIHFTGVRIVV